IRNIQVRVIKHGAPELLQHSLIGLQEVSLELNSALRNDGTNRLGLAVTLNVIRLNIVSQRHAGLLLDDARRLGGGRNIQLARSGILQSGNSRLINMIEQDREMQVRQHQISLS